MRIIVFDPSGNFKEGKGTSGICFADSGRITELSQIRAKDFSETEAYWYAHIELIKNHNWDWVVIEGYRLYNHRGMKASSQSNSEFETVQLIGALKMACWMNHIPCTIQYASEVKSRWSEKVLVNSGILENSNGRYYFNGLPTNTHQRDALKHALHFLRYDENAKK